MGELKVLGLIPARAGSKSILNKNLVNLGEKPLISWTISAALASKLDRVVVSTNDRQIAEVSQKYGAEVPFERPTNLSEDSSLSIDVVLHALEVLEHEFDAVMLLQPTSPFRTSEDINLALDLFPDVSSVISVVPVDGNHPARMKFIQDGFLIDPPFSEEVENMPRQKLTPMFIRNGAIYLTRVSVLKSRTFKGSRCRALVMSKERSLNIDTSFDLLIARAMLDGGLI